MKFAVEMHAFGAGKIRTVTVPDVEIGMAVATGNPDGALGPIFQYGQNDFASFEDLAQRMPSVSVGDIIQLPREQHHIASDIPPVDALVIDHEVVPPNQLVCEHCEFFAGRGGETCCPRRFVVMPFGFCEVAPDFQPPADDRGGFYAYPLVNVRVGGIGDFTDEGLAFTRAFRDAAVADGWSIEPTYEMEGVDRASRLKREGFVMQVVSRPDAGGRLLSSKTSAAIHIWGPDGLGITVPETYSWDAIRAGLFACMYCGTTRVEVERVNFAGRCCLRCLPEVRKRTEFPGWNS